MNWDEYFMREAISLARSAECLGEVPVGAVLVRDNEIIGRGFNSPIGDSDPTAHAEIDAIRAACRILGSFHLDGCTLYASSEPCPMCLSAAYWARVSRIVFANSRAEAAAIGFCDDELYCELNRHFSARSIVMEHRPITGALEPLEHWAANPCRIVY